MLQVAPGLHVHSGNTWATDRVAGFDLDWTLVRSVHAKFPRDANDWAFLPNRISTLQAYRDAGYILVIFTNQGYQGAKLQAMIERINNIIVALNREALNPWVFAATGKDSAYRKPSPNMWTVMQQRIGEVNVANSLYVGDAAGRPQDHSADDIEFARSVGLPFYTPEQIFPNNMISIPDTQTMFIFVGVPGSGKSTYYQQNLQPRGWVHVNQDTLKTAAAVLTAVRTALASGKSVAIDATNPSPDKRRQYVELAAQYQIPTLILYFVRDGHGWNDLRPNPVPTIAYNMYYKNLVEPTLDLDHVPVVQLT
jgi:bifunctional polynucleotide phosphatase/kinase